MEFLGPGLLVYLFLTVMAMVAFLVSATVCGWFIVKCVCAMFSEDVMRKVIRKPFFHLGWMLLAIPCGVYTIRGSLFLWQLMSK